MYKIVNCRDMEMGHLFTIFNDSFSDYEIQMEMDVSLFSKKFFESDRNERKYSFIAFDVNTPIGIVLGGLKLNELHSTLRCGGLGVIPSYRRKGVAKMLMEEHLKLAVELNCKQASLEVLKSNNKAIMLYKDMGYMISNELKYKWLSRETFVLRDYKSSYKVDQVSAEDLKVLLDGCHLSLPWQQSFECTKYKDTEYYGIYDRDMLVAGISVTQKTVNFMYVLPKYRLNGVGSALLDYVMKKRHNDGLLIVYGLNHDLETYTNKLEMSDYTGQFELYKWLH